MGVEPAYCELECLLSSVTSLWEHAMTIKVFVFQTMQLLACYCAQGHTGKLFIISQHRGCRMKLRFVFLYATSEKNNKKTAISRAECSRPDWISNQFHG